MNTRIHVLLLSIVAGSAAIARSQDVPPPPPAPSAGPYAPPPAAPALPPQQPAIPPAAGPQMADPQLSGPQPPPYYPPPGAVMIAPGQPYPYASPMVVAPRPVVIVPAPPMPSYAWSATVDALFLERSAGGSVPLGYSVYNPASNMRPSLPTANLYSDDAGFPQQAGIRLDVSHKLNDSLTVAATYWGLQQWSVSATIFGDPYQDTVLAFSPHLQLPTLLNGLDNSLGYTYASQIENVEINALIRLNSYDPYWEVDWLWGARYVGLSEQFSLVGSDALNSATENLDANTTNSMVGVQTGILFKHGWSGVQWETGLKLGLMGNFYHQHNTDTASDPSGTPAGFVPYDIANNGSDLAFLAELSIAARYQLTNNLSFHFGYQVYDVAGLALAPRQLGSFGHGGNVALDGISIGLQATW